jgi:hypothetical protein
MLQWEKKTVPDPRVPEIGGSSPKWSEAAATFASAPAPQKPASRAARSAPHSRGQSRHSRRASRARRDRARKLSASRRAVRHPGVDP